MKIYTADYGIGGAIFVIADDRDKAWAIVEREVKAYKDLYDGDPLPMCGSRDKHILDEHDLVHGFVHSAVGDL